MSKQRVAKKKKVILCAISVLFLALITWIVWGNAALELNTYVIRRSDLPFSFDGYRIAHISDLHNTEIGAKNRTLLSMLKKAEPDMIAITGDMIDSRNTNIEIALAFAEEAMQIAPCYYVSGNHEARVAEYNELKSGLNKAGVVVLEDEQRTLRSSEESITIAGINDPSFRTDYLFGDAASVVDAKLSSLALEEESFTILLSHRPELYDTYANCGIDLALSGHAHGGQFRLPFVGGIIAPNQGWFPEYDAGLYSQACTDMVVSRGIGNSAFPFRFNNRPEVLLIELKSLKG